MTTSSDTIRALVDRFDGALSTRRSVETHAATVEFLRADVDHRPGPVSDAFG